MKLVRESLIANEISVEDILLEHRLNINTEADVRIIKGYKRLSARLDFRVISIAYNGLLRLYNTVNAQVIDLNPLLAVLRKSITEYYNEMDIEVTEQEIEICFENVLSKLHTSN